MQKEPPGLSITDMIIFRNLNFVKSCEVIFLSVVLLELFLMGSGRLLEFGSVTLRMILFTLCIGLSIVYFTFSKRIVSKLTLGITAVYIILTLIATIIGLLNGSDETLIVEDIKPLSYFLMLLYFELSIINTERVQLVAKLVKFAAIALAMAYIGAILLLWAGKISFGSVQTLFADSSDFIFRGEVALFYKGFIYVCLGVIFFMQKKNIVSILLMIFCLTAIVLTMTKGFILMILVVMFLQMSLTAKRKIVLVPAVVLLATTLIFSLSWFQTRLGDKSASDQVRIVTMNEVYERMKSTALFVGHGFGNGVPERPVHMEVSFMEIFHKQGLAGVLFWLSLIVLILYHFKKIKNHNDLKIAMPFMLASVFLYLESLTNPFINNPIGMSFLLISLVAIRCLANDGYKAIPHHLSRPDSSYGP